MAEQVTATTQEYSASLGLCQCLSESFVVLQCVPIIIYMIVSLLLEFFLVYSLYLNVKFKHRLLKKKNLILICLLLANLAFLLYNIQRKPEYIYFFQNFFMAIQFNIVIFYFASKAFKMNSNENTTKLIKLCFGILLLYNIGILILNFVSFASSTNEEICKSGTWIYIRAVELILSLIFAGIGKYIINRMEEQLKQISFDHETIESNDSSVVSGPLTETINQYKHKVSQKRNIWLLIIINILAGISVNIKNFTILYNGREDCRYIGHVIIILRKIRFRIIAIIMFWGSNNKGDDDKTNGEDIADAVIVFLMKIFTYYLPITATLIIFKLRPEEMKVFSKEEYFEEGVFTTALGMKKAKRNPSEDDISETNDQHQEQEWNDQNNNEKKSKNDRKNKEKDITVVKEQSKSINDITPYNGDD